jgi:NAD(P)-dependent dehydrogenase (short-subunit alcohol dehydrogenase family)
MRPAIVDQAVRNPGFSKEASSIVAAAVSQHRGGSIMATTSVIIGGTAGIGLEIARQLAERGDRVIITGRDRARANTVAKTIGGKAEGIAVDTSKPAEITPALAGIDNVRNLVIGAIERDANTAKNYNIEGATRLATLKLVGYVEVIHALVPKFTKDASIVLFGGVAKDRPYPGSTTVSSVNGAITGMTRTLAVELAPVRVNAIHPGIIGDSPFWAEKTDALNRIIARTPIGRLATMAEIAHATIFLLDNGGINGIDLTVDGGWLLQ